MPIIVVIIICAVIGLLVWAITTYVPMPDAFKKLIIAVAIIGTVIWLLYVFGIWDMAANVRIPHK